MAARMKGHNQLLHLLVHLSQFLIMVIWYFGRHGVRKRVKFSFFLSFERCLFELDNSPVSRQTACLPLAPATFSHLPFVSVQRSRRRKPAEMGERKKNCLPYIPTAAFRTCCPLRVLQILPDLSLGGLKRDPAHSGGAAHMHVSPDPHSSISFNPCPKLVRSKIQTSKSPKKHGAAHLPPHLDKSPPSALQAASPAYPAQTYAICTQALERDPSTSTPPPKHSLQPHQPLNIHPPP